MSPAYLPVLGLLIAGAFLGAVCIRHLMARRWSAALRAGGRIAGIPGLHPAAGSPVPDTSLRSHASPAPA